MDYECQKTYASIINSLFQGTPLHVEPEQVNEGLVEMADQMFAEITTCHERIRPIAILFDGVANAVMELVPGEVKLFFGVEDLSKYVKDKVEDEGVKWFNKLLNKKLKESERFKDKEIDLTKYYAGLKVARAFYESWLKYTAKDRRLKVCIVTAQVRWRSKMEMELLGL